MSTNITWPERIVRFVIGAAILGFFGALPAPGVTSRSSG